jgi:RHS repeat-associated protein
MHFQVRKYAFSILQYLFGCIAVCCTDAAIAEGPWGLIDAVRTVVLVTVLFASGTLLVKLFARSRVVAVCVGLSAVGALSIAFVGCQDDPKPMTIGQRARANSREITQIPEGAEFYLTDHQHSPHAVTTAYGAVQSRSLYHAYGQVRHQSGAHRDPFGYVGNEEDRGSGLSDFNARPYRPELGTFMAVDPVALFEPERLIGNTALLNAYAYAGGDPINQSDPTGLTFSEFVQGFGAGLADVCKSATHAVVETAKSDIAMVTEGRLADLAKTTIIERAPIVTAARAAIATVESVASIGSDVAKAVSAPSDHETGRLAVKPVLTAMSVAATVLGTRVPGKTATGRAATSNLTLSVSNDGIATWVKVPGNEKAFARIVDEKGALHVTDIFGGGLPAGSGSQILAAGLKASGMRSGQQLVFKSVINEETLATFRAGGNAAESHLGRLGSKALGQLGLEASSFEFRMVRDKLDLAIGVK